ncbi:hypothetical protein L915_21687 [Phytophthora nicotianae]|uniref:Uncharacterized protein n=1 Tax=Phytophthora nicotianae TaxID=4792 RepID=W2FJM1_PHYNI|nr:hypothetical protein L915_21687 [Phytophthora nicotianae]
MRKRSRHRRIANLQDLHRQFYEGIMKAEHVSLVRMRHCATAKVLADPEMTTSMASFTRLPGCFASSMTYNPQGQSTSQAAVPSSGPGHAGGLL